MFTSREQTAIAVARAESVAQAGVPAHIIDVTPTTITLSNGTVIRTGVVRGGA
jgi:hypothetical protein